MLDAILLAIPLVLFALLVVAFFLLLRRAAKVMATTRELDALRQNVQALAARTGVTLGTAAERIDAVRRGSVAPDTISDALVEATEALARHRADAEAIVVPAGFGGVRSRLLEELERADRALEMVAHGCDSLSAMVARPRQAEGQTAVKRGYLNLLHAREAIGDVAAELRARPPRPDGKRFFSDRQPPE